MIVEERADRQWWHQALVPLGALLFTLVVAGILVLVAGAPLGRTFALVVEGALGSVFALTETLTRATPLIFTGLAAAVAFRAKLYNIGAEGQLMLGATFAVLVGGAHGGSGIEAPLPLLFFGMLTAGALAGALMLVLPAWLKVQLRVDEVVTTLLLNFVIALGVGALLDGPMKDPSAMGWPQSVALIPGLELSALVEKSRLHTGFWLALVAAILCWFLTRFTALGMEQAAIGSNARAARFLGVNDRSVLLKTAALSGALAGLAGVVEVAGRTQYVTLDMSPGYGYSGIVIAMLAGLSPLGVVASACFVAAILVGADSMSRVVAVPTYVADVMVACALIGVLVAGWLVRYRVRFDASSKEGARG